MLHFQWRYSQVLLFASFDKTPCLSVLALSLLSIGCSSDFNGARSVCCHHIVCSAFFRVAACAPQLVRSLLHVSRLRAALFKCNTDGLLMIRCVFSPYISDEFGETYSYAFHFLTFEVSGKMVAQTRLLALLASFRLRIDDPFSTDTTAVPYRFLSAFVQSP